jgi:ATP-dependent DNA helicase RecG
MGLMPVYHTSERMKRMGLTSEALRRYVIAALASIKTDLNETMPAWMLEKHKLIPLTQALRQIHFPRSAAEVREATYRLKFEELFYIQLQLLRYSAQRTQRYQGFPMPRVGGYFNEFYKHHLPFSLTEAQKRVMREIKTDIGSGRQMNRLLQGDVGSGKTLVALMSMLLAIDNGYQACLMAPTEILAGQHLETLQGFLDGMHVRVELLMGSVKGKQRTAILDAVQAGTVHVLVGTHALLEEAVVFARLGMVIIDEQHRFGVEQRSRLWTKTTQPPHILVMTATPIPRTLAMTLYGDLEVSVIDELPPGRKPIATLHRYTERRASLYEFLRVEIGKGRQVYIVYPLIEESKKKKLDLRNLEEGYEQVREAFPTCSISKVHGRLKSKEKEAEMARFARGETQIMVATTVIEVGVNVPNASVRVIENAERFGLAQLHQLRGRVGRGGEQSYCVLMTGYKLSPDTRKRIDIMVKTNDGFEIAEADLLMRGPGDLEGTQQSGIAFDLHIANIARDGQLLQHVRDIARSIIEADPTDTAPDNALLRQRLADLRKTQPVWSAIS